VDTDDIVDALLGILGLLASSPILLYISLLLSESYLYPVLGCLTLAGAFILGVTRRPVWTALVVALVATALNLALLLTRWKSAGILDTGLPVAGHLLAVFGIICGGGWVLGRCVSWLVGSAIFCVTWLIRSAIPRQS
jgi:hypothetical protein